MNSFIVLQLNPTTGNSRKSEGSFISLKDESTLLRGPNSFLKARNCVIVELPSVDRLAV